MNHSVEISIVSPVYKAENIVNELINRLTKVLQELTNSYEIILVDDNSPDNSWEKIKTCCNANTFVKGIKLSKNFGQQHALQAGLDASRGEYVITLDCDLQDPPEEIPKLIAKAKEGFEIVAASRVNRKDDFIKRTASKYFYKLLGYLTDSKQDNTVANFVCYHRKAVEAMALVKDNHRYYPLLQQVIGFNYTKVPIKHAERKDGKSSYSLKKRWKLAINTILAFSDKPLRITVKLGVSLSFLSIIAAIVLVILYFLGDFRTSGWASLALLLSFFSGAIISVLGMVGLYVGKIFETVKGRPTYIISEQLN